MVSMGSSPKSITLSTINFFSVECRVTPYKFNLRGRRNCGSKEKTV